MGEILTVIDAVVSDERQNKATKDLIKSSIDNLRNALWNSKEAWVDMGILNKDYKEVA